MRGVFSGERERDRDRLVTNPAAVPLDRTSIERPQANPPATFIQWLAQAAEW